MSHRFGDRQIQDGSEQPQFDIWIEEKDGVKRMFNRNARLSITVQAVSEDLQDIGPVLPAAIMLHHPLSHGDFWRVVHTDDEPGMFNSFDALISRYPSS